MSNTEYGFINAGLVPIPPGDGFEIVPADDLETADMDFTEDGHSWHTNFYAIGNHGKTKCGHYVEQGIRNILAFRRKKTEQKPDPRFGEWVSVHKSYPPADNWEKEWLCWFNYGKAAAQTTKQIYNAGNCSCLTHWMPLPAPPDPEKSEEDQQFEEWYFKTWPEYQDLGLPASHMGFCRTTWKARGELERSRKKE